MLFRSVPRRYRIFSSSDEHPPSPGLVRQGDSAFIIICIMCSFFPGSFGIVFSQLCNVFCVGPPSPPGALSSLSPLWGCMPLGTYKQLTSQLGSLLQPGPDSFHPWFHNVSHLNTISLKLQAHRLTVGLVFSNISLPSSYCHLCCSGPNHSQLRS